MRSQKGGAGETKLRGEGAKGSRERAGGCGVGDGAAPGCRWATRERRDGGEKEERGEKRRERRKKGRFLHSQPQRPHTNRRSRGRRRRPSTLSLSHTHTHTHTHTYIHTHGRHAGRARVRAGAVKAARRKNKAKNREGPPRKRTPIKQTGPLLFSCAALHLCGKRERERERERESARPSAALAGG